jgi:hypothetical protein
MKEYLDGFRHAAYTIKETAQSRRKAIHKIPRWKKALIVRGANETLYRERRDWQRGYTDGILAALGH